MGKNFFKMNFNTKKYILCFIFALTLLFLLILNTAEGAEENVCTDPGGWCWNDGGCSDDTFVCGDGNRRYWCDYSCNVIICRVKSSLKEDCDRCDGCLTVEKIGKNCPLGFTGRWYDYSCSWGFCMLDSNNCHPDCNAECGYDTAVGCPDYCVGSFRQYNGRCNADCRCEHYSEHCPHGCEDGVCHPPEECLCKGVTCPTCQYCDLATGNCVNHTDGFNDCDAGCQRCVGGACTDWDAACPGTCSAGYEINFDCVSDVCTGSKCTKPCCVAHYGTGAFCDGGVCHPPNEPPVASIECDGTYCDTVGCLAYTGCVFHFLNNSTDPDGQDDIVLSEWDIIGWGAEPDLKCVPPNALCNYTPPIAILTPGIYTVTLLVEDLFGASDTHSITWTLRREALALFECSLDNITWLACDDPGFRPFQGERAYFKDNSSPSENGVSIVSRTWRKNGAVFDDNNNPNPFIALTEAPTIITLTVTDNKGRTDSQSYEIVVRMPLPEWWEVAPIGWLRKFLTGAVDFVNSF